MFINFILFFKITHKILEEKIKNNPHYPNSPLITNHMQQHPVTLCLTVQLLRSLTKIITKPKVLRSKKEYMFLSIRGVTESMEKNISPPTMNKEVYIL